MPSYGGNAMLNTYLWVNCYIIAYIKVGAYFERLTGQGK